MNSDPAKQAWQASVDIAGAPPLDEVRKGADKFYRFVKWRNFAEYVASVIVVASFASYIFVRPHLFEKIGAGLIVLAALYVPWQLHRRASAEPLERAGTMPILEFSRLQLVRQRDALRAVFWWYILPFVPGFVLFIMGNAAGRAGETTALVPLSWGAWVFLGLFAILLFGIWRFNQRVADKLQRHIDEIDALTGGIE